MKGFWKRIRSGLTKATEPERYLIVVLPGNYRQFHNWCYKNEYRPTDRNLLCVLQGDSGSKLHGVGQIVKEFRFIGTYRSRTDMEEVLYHVDYYQHLYPGIESYFEPWEC